jgi:hypothetical protein
MLNKCIYLPSNLNLELIVKECPPSFKYDLDYLKYTAHYIYTKPSLLHDYYESNSMFIEVSSTNLKNRIPNYRNYLDYLIENKIIITDNQYIASSTGYDSKCKGYCFDIDYNNGPKLDKISKFTLIRNIGKHNLKTARLIARYKNLTQWFNKGLLKIDKLGAMQTINVLYESDLNSSETFVKDRAELRKIDRELKVLKIANDDLFYGCDGNVGRFHSNLTTLNKAFRKHITYNGQKLVSVDLINSQPLFSTMLLSREFYDSRSNSFNKSYLRSKKLDSYNLLNKVLLQSNKYITSTLYTMFREYPVINGALSVNSYSALVLNGKLYERFSEAVYAKTKIQLNRKETKKAIFLVLYSSNRHYSIYKKIFKEIFPNEYEIFRNLKKNEKSLLPRVLQMIEAYVFLDIISKRISKEKPDLPIFTVHDSIVTTVGNEDYVRQVCVEEFKRVLSIDAPFKFEYWDEESN